MFTSRAFRLRWGLSSFCFICEPALKQYAFKSTLIQHRTVTQRDRKGSLVGFLELTMTRLANCAVCGDKATRLRYSHYGAVSCFSCRAFFRRAIEKGANYLCQKDHQAGKCAINIQTRKKCAACRFNKCIVVGMKHGHPQTAVSYFRYIIHEAMK